MACGAVMAGKRSVVMFQNSGLGNAVNPLTSLNYPFRIPLLLIVTLRGEPFGPKDEPQHELMGEITTAMLETLRNQGSLKGVRRLARMGVTGLEPVTSSL